jgi:hypothetical protein
LFIGAWNFHDFHKAVNFDIVNKLLFLNNSRGIL